MIKHQIPDVTKEVAVFQLHLSHIIYEKTKLGLQLAQCTQKKQRQRHR